MISPLAEGRPQARLAARSWLLVVLLVTAIPPATYAAERSGAPSGGTSREAEWLLERVRRAVSSGARRIEDVQSIAVEQEQRWNWQPDVLSHVSHTLLPPDRYRKRVWFDGGDVTNTLDGTDFWQSAGIPEGLASRARANITLEARRRALQFLLRTNGLSLVLATRPAPGHPGEVTFMAGTQSLATLVVDPTSHRPVAWRHASECGEVVEHVEDYHDVGGLWFPRRIRFDCGAPRAEFVNVRIAIDDPGVTPALFARP
ncbi:MAG: hypothetical protein NDJ94_15885 [Vicinamibacteria bacterium]|nr:hypothetical protein [Vicinamibacteria bacterium]